MLVDRTTLVVALRFLPNHIIQLVLLDHEF